MAWVGLVAGLLIAWALSELLGLRPGLLALGALAGLLYIRLRDRQARLEARLAALQARLERLAAQPSAAAAPPPTAAAAPQAGTGRPAPPVPSPATAPATAPETATVPAARPARDSGFEDWDDTPPRAPSDPAARPAPARPSARPPAGLEIDEQSPSVTSSLGASLLAWVRGGNTIVRLAVLILFTGVAFLLRYAAERDLLPIELRLAGVAAGGLALAALGWKLRERRRGYGLSLQGAGIGLLYLTLFAALRLYGLLPPALAFVLLVALAVIGALLAMLQDALPLAVLGFAGGFLAPVLTSTGQGSHVVLFSYYLVLNLAIAWIASRQAWKLLNLLGFGLTFGIGLAWGLRSYTPALFASTEPFLMAHFALYLYITVQYSRQLAALRAPRLAYVDGGLVFGLPIIAFGLQAGLVRHLPDGLAVSAAVLSALYLGLARWLWRRGGESLRLLTEGMFALGLVFLALVAPLALDARWTAAAWAVQGAGVTWIALRQRRLWALALGLLLQVGAGLSFWGSYARGAALTPFLHGLYLGVLLLALAAALSAWLLQRQARTLPPDPEADEAPLAWSAPLLHSLHWTALGVALLHFLVGTGLELGAADWAVPGPAQRSVLLFGLTALALEALHRRLDWPQLALPARPLLGLALAVSLGATLDALASAPPGWSRWASAGLPELAALLAAGLWLLHRLDHDPRRPVGSLAFEPLALGWYALLQGGLLLYSATAHFVARHEAWTPTAAIVLPTLLAMATLRRLSLSRWPQSRHAAAWFQGLVLPWMGLLLLWVAVVNLVADGSMQPLPHVPLLNPVDLGHALVALYALRLVQGAPRLAASGADALRAPVPRALLAAAVFWWLNSLLVRTLHHGWGTPMWLDGALQSGLVQTALTLLWTVAALGAMLWAARRGGASARAVWIAGAALLAAVVLKLLLVDLSHTSTLQRIFSFIGVGLLMLVIGYVSPLPPAGGTQRRSAA